MKLILLPTSVFDSVVNFKRRLEVIVLRCLCHLMDRVSLLMLQLTVTGTFQKLSTNNVHALVL